MRKKSPGVLCARATATRADTARTALAPPLSERARTVSHRCLGPRPTSGPARKPRGTTGIAHLHDLGLICRADGDTLNEALRLRDEIVHGGALAERRRIEHLASLINAITHRVATVTTAREHEPAARDR